jgi:hypothetical protein
VGGGAVVGFSVGGGDVRPEGVGDTRVA